MPQAATPLLGLGSGERGGSLLSWSNADVNDVDVLLASGSVGFCDRESLECFDANAR